MSNIKVNISLEKKKDVNTYLNYALDFIPCASFLFSLICCFSSNDSTFVFCLTYILVIAFHGIRIYLTATNKNFLGKNTTPQDKLLKTIWCGKHVHYVILALALLLFNCHPLTFFVSYGLYSIRKAVKTLQQYVAPRLGDNRAPLDNFAKAVLENENVKNARGAVCVIGTPYIFFAALFTFRFNYFLVFLIYVVNDTLYGLMGDKEQKWFYGQIDKFILNSTKDNKQARDTYKKVVEQLAKVKDVAKSIYPIPQNIFEKGQQVVNDLKGK